MSTDNTNNEIDREKTVKKKNKAPYIIGSLLIVVIAIMAVVIMSNGKKKESEPEVVTVSQLYKIINTSQLSTYQCTYNAICKVYNNENPENIDFYCSYEAKVKAGIDLKEITITQDEENKKFIVTVPKITLGEPIVDIATLDYMFEDEKTNTQDVSERAYKECIKDVKNKSENETEIYNLAAKNAQNTVKALISPFLDQMGEGYSLIVNMEGAE